MGVVRITISIDDRLLDRLNLLVQSRLFTSRSQAVQEAVQEKVARIGKTRLAEECVKLDPAEEQTFSEERLAAEVSQWPSYDRPDQVFQGQDQPDMHPLQTAVKQQVHTAVRQQGRRGRAQKESGVASSGLR